MIQSDKLNGRRWAMLAFLLTTMIGLSVAVQASAQMPYDTGPSNEDVQQAFRQGNYPWYDADQDALNLKPDILDGEDAKTANRNQIAKARVAPQQATTSGSGRGWLTLWIIVLIIAVLIVVGAVIWLVVRMDPPSGFRDNQGAGDDGRSFGSDRVESLPFELKKTSGNFRAESEAAFRARNYRLAVTYLFSHVLLTLDRHHHIRLRRGKTNRQYLMELNSSSSAALTEYYEYLMVSFESAFFGNHELQRERFEQSWNALPAFEAQVTRLAESTSKSRAGAVAVGLLLLILVGCGDSSRQRQQQIQSSYGRKSGNSLNGTSVLAELIRDSGRSVNRAESITPRINQFERIIWFRDRFETPSPEAIEKLETWLAYGYNRQLIIVGRDYDSAIDYWTSVSQNTTGNARIQARRQLAKAKADFQQRRNGRDLAQDQCDWYWIKKNDFSKAKQFTGEWAEEIDISQADIQVGLMMDPVQPKISTPWRKRLVPSEKLLVDGTPMVTVMSRDDFDGGGIYLVSNASFLTNYGLVNPENRKLAGKLINSQKYNSGATLFLETGANKARISTSNSDHQTWAWITRPPLKYMVPHFLIVGVFFCFVLYPIFGRAKRADPGKDQTTFRDHIRAMGRLLASSGHFSHAQDKLKKYTNRHWKEHEK